jgi:CRP-like cAMP-binding protein
MNSMTQTTLPPTTNRLIDRLPAQDRIQLLASCEPAQLQLSRVLHEPGSPVRHVYFPTHSYISLVVPMESAGFLEVGLAGREGLYGLPLVLGAQASPVRAVVQGAGSAWRISGARYQQAAGDMPAVGALLSRYAHVTIAQLGRTAGCNRYHRVEQRVARWMLMTADRAQSDTFHLTHEFLAYMLGVRRAGVSEAASSLQRLGLIDYSRGIVRVNDRRRLEKASCRCYRSDLEVYDQVMQRPRRRRSTRASVR